MATRRDHLGKAKFFAAVADKEERRGNHVMAGLLRRVVQVELEAAERKAKGR